MHTESFKKGACNSVPRAPPIFAGPFYCCRKQEYTGMLMPFRLKKRIKLKRCVTHNQIKTIRSKNKLCLAFLHLK